MGICFHDIRLMFNARKAGASFDRVLTIGRQNLCLHPAEADFFISSLAGSPAAAQLARDNCSFGAFAEPFLHACLGAGTVEALDYSPYEGAQHVHDMNEPVPESLTGRFDVVIDGGALEHIFNFPIAISNLMRMVKVGGRIFMSTPANNFCGHGFYQFSPELMFRIFAAENGFEIRTVQLVESRYPSQELTHNKAAYIVTDPRDVQRRVGLVSKRPVMMLVEALKLRETCLFARAPLQSDYVSTWSAARTVAHSDSGSRLSWRQRWRSRVLAIVPRALRIRLIGRAQLRQFSFRNRSFYRTDP